MTKELNKDLLDRVVWQLGILRPEKIFFLGSKLYSDFMDKTGYENTRLLPDITLPGNKQKYLNYAIDNNILVQDITLKLHKDSLSDMEVEEIIKCNLSFSKNKLLKFTRETCGAVSTSRFTKIYERIHNAYSN